MTKSLPSPSHIHALPDLTEYTPLWQDYSPRITDRTSSVQVSMQKVNTADFLGLTIFLCNCAMAVNAKGQVKLHLLFPKEDKSVLENLIRVYDPLHVLRSVGVEVPPQIDLISDTNINVGDSIDAIQFHTESTHQLRLIVYPGKDRETQLTFVRKSLKEFYQKSKSKKINFPQFNFIFIEIIKNTIDHSAMPGVFACKISNSKSDKNESISFCYCDLGEGIVKNVRNYIKDKESRLSAKGGLTDIIHWALQVGNSSKLNNGINSGLGLSTIEGASRGLEMELYMKEANSLFFLSRLPPSHSHSELREHQTTTKNALCSMYFGYKKNV